MGLSVWGHGLGTGLDNKIMEDKMLKIQKDVSNLKRDFKKIQLRNEALNREYQVPREKFQMTDFTYKMIHEDIENKLKEVVKSRAVKLELVKDTLIQSHTIGL